MVNLYINIYILQCGYSHWPWLNTTTKGPPSPTTNNTPRMPHPHPTNTKPGCPPSQPTNTQPGDTHSHPTTQKLGAHPSSQRTRILEAHPSSQRKKLLEYLDKVVKFPECDHSLKKLHSTILLQLLALSHLNHVIIMIKTYNETSKYMK